MTHFADRASLDLLSALTSAAARSLILAGVAGMGLIASRTKAASLRLFTWTAVLYANLALPLIGAFLPPLQVRMPQFLQHRMTSTAANNSEHLLHARAVAIPAATTNVMAKLSSGDRRDIISKNSVPWKTQRASGESTPLAWSTMSWNIIAAAIYLAFALLFLGRVATGIIWSGKLLNRSQRIPQSVAMAKLTDRAGRPAPRLASSEHISVPVTVGAFRSTILLPSDWQEWDRQKLDAVLAHELSHVDRHDALAQRTALLYRAIFWFHPLSWWLHRQIATLAEQASDEAALAGGADRKNYARTLLDFFRTLRTTPGRIRWEGVSMARAGQAEQRLERILTWKGTFPMSVNRSLAAAILVLALPVIYLAASVRPAVASSDDAVSQQPAAPAIPAAPPVGGISAVPPMAGTPSMAPVAPVGPVAPVAPAVAPSTPLAPESAWNRFGVSQSSGTSHSRGFSYHYGFDDEERFVIVSGKSDSLTMSGSSQDARHVEKLKKQIPGDFIWFQRDEKSYIIRDQATIDRARAFWAPQEELGRKQEELGKQQEELGKQQEELGAKMEQVKVNVPDMTAALDKLKAKLQKLGPTATMEQIGDLQSEIGELQSRLGEIQSQAGEQQGKLGELQGALGEKQGKLGEQQGKLGEQQGELAEKASRQMKELLDEAIKNGIAKPEDEMVRSPTL